MVLHTTSRIARRTDVNGNAAFYEPGLMNRDVWFSFERTDYTDNAGWIAWSDPDRIGQRVSFEVVAPGYRSPDAIVAFETTPGGTATLQLERLNLAERLYRVTGQGRYTDSVLLGAAAPSRARCSTPT